MKIVVCVYVRGCLGIGPIFYEIMMMTMIVIMMTLTLLAVTFLFRDKPSPNVGRTRFANFTGGGFDQQSIALLFHLYTLYSF